jgi:diguanylate cyclase (GGDEF)-like protein
MSAALTHRGALSVAAFTAYAGVTTGLVVLEVPGLGIGHLFYVPIALLALATSPMVGAFAGVLATAAYAVGLALNPALPADELLTTSTAVRGVTYVSTGALIGFFASTNRDLVGRLSELAQRDFLTGLLNARAFDEELHRRCAFPRPFALLLGDLDGLKEVNDRGGHAEGNALLRRVAGSLRECARADDLVARVGGDEFALLIDVADAEEAVELCRSLEGRLEDKGLAISFGWALHPSDGGTTITLYRRADERLYSSKAARKSREKVHALLRRV